MSMQVFISWSGTQSKAIAEVFRSWLPGVLQFVKPFFTPNDIEKGARWQNEIASSLSDCSVGLFVMTQESVSSNWLMFEAGAVSKTLDQTRVCPMLFGIGTTDITGPMAQFQAAEFSKTDVFTFLTTVNKAAGEEGLPQKVLESVFEKWWPDLESGVAEAQRSSGDAGSTDIRTDRDILEEILLLTRRGVKQRGRFGPARDFYSVKTDLQLALDGITSEEHLNRLHEIYDNLASKLVDQSLLDQEEDDFPVHVMGQMARIKEKIDFLKHHDTR